MERLIASQRYDGNNNFVMGTHQTYNEHNQLTGQSWQLGSTGYSESYTYDSSDGSLSAVTSAVGQTLSYQYDYLRRLGSVSTGVYTRNYTYRDISTTQTTTQVSRVSYSGLPSNPSYGYTYDALGNILSYTAPDGEVITYTYDNQNQLTRAAGSTTYNYTYDVFGNVRSNNYHSFTYGNNGWGDLLVTVDGQGIAYEGQSISGSTVSGLAISGNPISYYNGTRWTFDWAEGRNLVSASGGGNTITYAYDHNGVRNSKTVNGVVHNYYYASGKLLRETYGSNTLDFFYDASGMPFAVKYNGTAYYYITNLQGDVMQLVDANGATVASYEYDPYGTVISATGTMAEINPLRYRGYYYDTDTGFYYLQSRYYDPEIGRFINADSYTSTGQGILGHNMFAYCGNNPTSRCDTAGCFWDTVLDVVSLCFSIAEVIENPGDVSAWIGVAADAAALAIPFVAGAGVIIDVINKSDDAVDALKASSDLPVVIGEGMDRVRRYAQEIGGAELFEVATEWTEKEIMSNNVSWINQMMEEGRKVIDIGSNPNVQGRISDFYVMELTETIGYQFFQSVRPGY